MAAPSITSLRNHLRSVLAKEDDLLGEYKSAHGRLHTIDRDLITSANEAASKGTVLNPRWLKYMHGKRREASWQMVMKREKIRPLMEKRRELLVQIVEMETKIKRADEELKNKKAGEGSKVKGSAKKG